MPGSAGIPAGESGAHDPRRQGCRLTSPVQAWVAAERLPLVRAVYPHAQVETHVVPPESESKKIWERSGAIRELVRSRMEIVGPATAHGLAHFFQLTLNEIEGALLALEAEGFLLRGKFHPGTSEVEWCD